MSATVDPNDHTFLRGQNGGFHCFLLTARSSAPAPVHARELAVDMPANRRQWAYRKTADRRQRDEGLKKNM